MLHALWREAIYLVQEGVAAPEEIDTVVRLTFALRMPALGPLENMDLVGLDLIGAIHDYLMPSLSNDGETLPALRERIGRGELGAKSGTGFYDWSGRRRLRSGRTPGPADRPPARIPARDRQPVNPAVFVPEPIAACGMALLEAACDCTAPWAEGNVPSEAEARELLRGADAVIVRLFGIGAADLERCPRLRVIAKHGVGVDNIDCGRGHRARHPRRVHPQGERQLGRRAHGRADAGPGPERRPGLRRPARRTVRRAGPVHRRRPGRQDPRRHRAGPYRQPCGGDRCGRPGDEGLRLRPLRRTKRVRGAGRTGDVARRAARHGGLPHLSRGAERGDPPPARRPAHRQAQARLPRAHTPLVAP